jgi:hypothetical protein
VRAAGKAVPQRKWAKKVNATIEITEAGERFVTTMPPHGCGERAEAEAVLADIKKGPVSAGPREMNLPGSRTRLCGAIRLELLRGSIQLLSTISDTVDQLLSLIRREAMLSGEVTDLIALAAGDASTVLPSGPCGFCACHIKPHLTLKYADERIRSFCCSFLPDVRASWWVT